MTWLSSRASSRDLVQGACPGHEKARGADHTFKFRQSRPGIQRPHAASSRGCAYTGMEGRTVLGLELHTHPLQRWQNLWIECGLAGSDPR